MCFILHLLNKFFLSWFTALISGLFITLFVSCDKAYAPKPQGYFRIEFPEKKYKPFSPEDCPFSFEIPQYAEMVRDTNRLAEPCWYYIKFPRYNGEIFLSHKQISGNLNRYIEDAYTLAYKHSVRADEINEKRIRNNDGTFALIYEIGGNAASSVQFFVTDSTRNFIRGALYFNVLPNNDSLKPVIAFLNRDIQHLIRTIEWK